MENKTLIIQQVDVGFIERLFSNFIQLEILNRNFSHYYREYLTNLTAQLEEQDSSEKFKGRNLYILGIWVEMKKIMMDCHLEELGVILQPPYIQDHIFLNLQEWFEDEDTPKRFGFQEEQRTRMVPLLIACRIPIIQLNLQQDAFHLKMSALL